MIGYTGKSDCAKEDRIIPTKFCDSIFRHHSAGTGVCLATPLELFPAKVDIELPANRLEDTDPFWDHLFTDPITRDHGNLVARHTLAPSCLSPLNNKFQNSLFDVHCSKFDI
jgi:hypothetical protein